MPYVVVCISEVIMIYSQHRRWFIDPVLHRCGSRSNARLSPAIFFWSAEDCASSASRVVLWENRRCIGTAGCYNVCDIVLQVFDVDRVKQQESGYVSFPGSEERDRLQREVDRLNKDMAQVQASIAALIVVWGSPFLISSHGAANT